MTLAPNTYWCIVSPQTNRDAVNHYVKCANRSERDRMSDVKTSQVCLQGRMQFIRWGRLVSFDRDCACGYGTSMAVLRGSARFEFAKKFDIPLPTFLLMCWYLEKLSSQTPIFNGLMAAEATQTAIDYLENWSRKGNSVSFMRFLSSTLLETLCISKWNSTSITEHCLPLMLPQVEKYLPTETEIHLRKCHKMGLAWSWWKSGFYRFDRQ